MLSVTALAVTAGVGLALAGVLEIAAHVPWLIYVIELALVLTLFADGLTAEQELLRRRWRDPARALCRSRSS